MESGPESMPVFSDNELTPDQKKAIVTYVFPNHEKQSQLAKSVRIA